MRIVIRVSLRSDALFFKRQSNTMGKMKQLQSELDQFCGTGNFYSIAIIKTNFTDGIKFLAEQTNCFWLIMDASIVAKRLMDKSYFIVIDFKKCSDKERMYGSPDAFITYSDGNGNELHSKEYHFTDFPLNTLRLFFVDGTLMLPGEY